MLTHKELKARTLERPDVKTEYERLEEEFSFFDAFMKVRAAASITQAEVSEPSAQEGRKVNGLTKSLKRAAAKRPPRTITRTAHK